MKRLTFAFGACLPAQPFMCANRLQAVVTIPACTKKTLQSAYKAAVLQVVFGVLQQLRLLQTSKHIQSLHIVAVPEVKLIGIGQQCPLLAAKNDVYAIAENR